jgi:hypothetical protein
VSEMFGGKLQRTGDVRRFETIRFLDANWHRAEFPRL